MRMGGWQGVLVSGAISDLTRTLGRTHEHARACQDLGSKTRLRLALSTFYLLLASVPAASNLTRAHTTARRVAYAEVGTRLSGRPHLGYM